uniref:Uncharacterized protein n=1 Tax=Arundo donax TaxID=35708 RepID=A0A0A9AM40_ARUDO
MSALALAYMFDGRYAVYNVYEIDCFTCLPFGINFWLLALS